MFYELTMFLFGLHIAYYVKRDAASQIGQMSMDMFHCHFNNFTSKLILNNLFVCIPHGYLCQPGS